MTDYETKACIVCLKPSLGKIATGNVKTVDGEEILATFCSDDCAAQAPRADSLGTYGFWTGPMGRIKTGSAQ